jgi:hypothetical protein
MLPDLIGGTKKVVFKNFEDQVIPQLWFKILAAVANSASAPK